MRLPGTKQWGFKSSGCLAGALALVLLAGIALRIAYWPELVTSAPFIAPTTDASYHDHWAKGLAFGDWTLPSDATGDPRIPEQPFFRPPGYPYFLALVYRLFGPGPYVPRLFNMLLDLCGTLCLFFLARRIFGPGPALISALLAWTYWGLLYFEGMLFEPSLLFCLMAAGLLACSRWTERIGWANSLAAGGLFGLGGLVRPNLLVCVPVCLGWGLWLAWRQRAGWKPAARLVAALVGALLVVLAPALWRNYRVSGAWPVLTTNGGINLYIANNPETDCMTSTLPRDFKAIAGLTGSEWTSFDYPRLVAALSRALERELTAVGADRHLRNVARSYIRRHPRQTARNLWTKTLLFWGPHEIANNLVIALDRQHSRVLRRGLNFPAVLATALLGLFLFLRPVPGGDTPGRNGRAAGWLVALVVAAYFASYLPFFIAGRYRLAVVPFLLVFSGQGLWSLFHWLRTRSYWLALAVGAFLIAGYGILSRPAVHYPSEAELWHAQQAFALLATGRPAEAAAQYRRAIELSPRNANFHNNLGAALMESGDPAGALVVLQRAVELGPGVPHAQANLARAHMMLNQMEAAEEGYRQALRFRPDRAEWWNRLGVCLALRNDPEAGDCFRKAIELDPGNPEAQANWRRWQHEHPGPEPVPATP